MSRLLRSLPSLHATTRLSSPIIPATSRLLTTTPSTRADLFRQGPSPPRLPAEQQAEFERLQRDASARHPESDATTTTSTSTSESSTDSIAAVGGLSGGVRRGAPPEFEGETNPKTGEVGGPKNEPLRWGGEGDWSYNGRVTDF